MAAGEAEAIHRARRVPVVIVDRHNRIQWSELYEGLDFILRRHQRHSIRLVNAPGTRPYIVDKTPTRWLWKRYTPKPATIVFKPEERQFAQPFAGAIMLEPNVKEQAHANKAWPFERWQTVAAQLLAAGHRVVQCVPPGARVLRGVEVAHTPSIRHACAVLAVVKSFAGTEGALHHAAAAVSCQAVVLWSEFIDPSVTGYAYQVNLRKAFRTCGARTPCATCAESMARITVAEVVASIEETIHVP